MVGHQPDLHPILYASFEFSPPLSCPSEPICGLGAGHREQGLDRTKLAYWNPLQPGLAIWGVFWTSVFILVNGYQVFFVWNTQDFLTAYINIPIFFSLWIGWTLYMRTPFWRADEMDFVTVRWSACFVLILLTHSCAWFSGHPDARGDGQPRRASPQLE